MNKKKAFLLLLFLILIVKTQMVHGQKIQPAKSKNSLSQLKYIELPLGAIKPKGWLYQQLITMKNGATGHLDEYYWKLKNDNGWLGGKGDNWEETPYWLDGALPLAYLLDDDTLKQKVLKYVNWTLDHQRPSGFFGAYTKAELEGKQTTQSCTNGDDWWPRMVMLKVMQQYYTATKDPRVIPFLTKYFKYQLKSLTQCSLGKWSEWATARGGDNIMAAYWLYRITGEKYLLKLADLLYQQTTPWTNYLGARNWAIQAAANQTGEKWMDRHGVNVAMGIKLPAIYYQSKNSRRYLDSLKTGFKDLMTLHGLPHGMFSADEDLHGNDPTQGVELCAIVETMFSLEQIIAITGDNYYMDALERITFNALPTQTTDDYISRQYFQIANQVQVSRGVFNFSLPFDRGMNNVFGPYAGYTCCTANMHQGWTKFTEHLWYATPEKGLAALLYSPCTVTAKVADGTEVSINEETAYPFGDSVLFTITTPKAVPFPMSLRIPVWCKSASILVNGKKVQSSDGGKTVSINRIWKNKDRVTLQFPMAVTTSNWAKNSRAIERGPLVYALKVEEKWAKDSIAQEGTYYTIQPVSNWNYGLPQSVIKSPDSTTTVITKPVTTAYVWDRENAPVQIETVGKLIPDWQLINGVAKQPVTTREGFYQGNVNDKEEKITLIPYGCSKLRVVAFPVVK